MKTIEQTIWFAQRGQITDAQGEGYHTTKARIKAQWDKPTLWVHGQDNGLSDAVSPLMTANVFEQSQIGHQFSVQMYEGLGHQDTIMGAKSQPVFRDIANHLLAAEKH